MNEVENQLNKLGMMKKPLEVATASVVLCFASKKILGVRVGINCETPLGAIKAFGVITAIGAAVEWYNKKE